MLTQLDEDRLDEALTTMLTEKVVTIPDTVVKPLLTFMKYTIVGAFHLNKFAAGTSVVDPVDPNVIPVSQKRKRLVIRLSEGLLRIKKRKFPISKLKESFASWTLAELDEQIQILNSHAVVSKPTHELLSLCDVSVRMQRSILNLTVAFQLMKSLLWKRPILY